MSIASLKKQFQKELKANPKKAAILGLLALVAVYFWVPLALKLLPGGKSKTATNSEVASTEPGSAEAAPIPGSSNQTTATNKDSTTALSWKQIVELLQQDPLIRTYPQIKNEHDPFQRVEKVTEVATGPEGSGESSPEPEVVERDLSPEALGMQLSSTIVGPARSAALIDQRAYAIGQRVVGFAGTEKVVFTLSEIQTDRVILQREEQEYVLKIKTNNDAAVVVEEDSL